MSVDPSDKTVELRDRLGLTFPLYRDADRSVIEAWGVADPNNDEIALPATFVIAPGGAVQFAHVGKSKDDRPSVETILQHVTATRSGASR